MLTYARIHLVARHSFCDQVSIVNFFFEEPVLATLLLCRLVQGNTL
jgi:hypothetical protein